MTGDKHSTPPVAMKVPRLKIIHGHARVDDYNWLEDKDSQDVMAYLRAENAYAANVMERRTGDLQKRLYREIKQRYREDDVNAPEKIGDYFYYSKHVTGKQYKTYCRKYKSMRAPEEILLDLNLIVANREYVRLAYVKPSPDHQYVAYALDFEGLEHFGIYIKDAKTGNLFPEIISNSHYCFEWGNDSRTFFYNILDDRGSPVAIYRHRLGGDPASDELVYRETDQRFFVECEKSTSREYIFITVTSNITSEVFYISANHPESALTKIRGRRAGIKYRVFHHKKHFYIITNENALNFKVVKAPTNRPGEWHDFLPARDDRLIENCDIFRDHIAIYERENGLDRIRIINLVNGHRHYIKFDAAAYTVTKNRNPEFNTSVFRYTYSSMIMPRCVYDYDMEKKTTMLVKKTKVKGEYDPSRYKTERVYAVAADGVKIPISLLYLRGMKKIGKNPLFIYGYGAYGFSADPDFASHRFSLVDRGFIYAIAHVRGGQELGRQWYENGKGLKKKNTFQDFIACTEYLIAEKYTSKDLVIASGTSAGGMLMGAVANMRPELYKAIIAHVPFVDVLNTMLNHDLMLTAIEFDEWGNPENKHSYDYIKSYAPYENVTTKEYPHMLITGAFNDPRVPYWEPAKWTAKLRALKTGQNILLLKTDLGSGHSGRTGRFNQMRETALEYAFIFMVLGITVA